MNELSEAKSQPRLGAVRRTRLVFVRDLEISTLVGVHEHEKDNPQRIIVGAELTVLDEFDSIDDRIENVICYSGVIDLVKDVCSAGHVNLLETLAERIATRVLEDGRVLVARISIEKPDIFDDCASVGVAIERLQTSS